MADPNPEFAPDIAARAASAVLELLQDNAALEAYFAPGDGIYDIESEQVTVDDGSLRAPGLGVSIGPLTERATGNANYAEMAVGIDLWMYTQIESRRGTGGWLRSRLVDAIKAVLAAEAGVLYDALGVEITEARWDFDRIDFRGRLRGKAVLLTPMRFTVYADFNRVTREVA